MFVRDYMTRNVTTLADDVKLLDAALMIRRTGKRHVPIVSAKTGKLVGIISDRDILRLTPSVLSSEMTEDLSQLDGIVLWGQASEELSEPTLRFSHPALASEYLQENKGKLSNGVHALPKEVDRQIANLKLKAMGIRIDQLTEAQARYLSSWEEGT